LAGRNSIPYFIEYNVHKSMVRNWILQWFLAKNYFYFSRIISQELIIASFIHHKSHLKTLLSYLPCIVRREYFSIIFNVNKRTLYSIKYGTHHTIQKVIFINLPSSMSFLWKTLVYNNNFGINNQYLPLGSTLYSHLWN
jgi:hypothetical protein